jgi:GxxExxY protein
MESEYLHKDLTEKIISAFYNVYNTLGFGFLEKVYENALTIELNNIGLEVETKLPINVYYKESNAGNYFADLVVESRVIIELKAIETLLKEHELQLINYLKATDFEVGLLLNLGKQPEIKRKIFTKNYKKHDSTQIKQI